MEPAQMQPAVGDAVAEPAEMEADDQVHCLICHSLNVQFRYNNNDKIDQPRYMCLGCKTMFTWGDHNRPKPQHYGKKRNQDPDHFRGLRTECSKCGTVNNARFKYYNNKHKYGETQPRFGCLSCDEQFQMRFEGGVLLSGKATKPTKPTKPRRTSNTKRGNKARSTVGVPPMPPTAAPASAYDVGNYVDPVGPWSNYSVQDASCQYEVGESGDQLGQLYNYANDEQVFSGAESVEVEQSDGGQYSYTGEMVAPASAVPWSSFHEVPNDHVASACDYDVTGISAEELRRLLNPDDEVFFAARLNPEEQCDVGEYYEGEPDKVEEGDQYLVNADADQVEERGGGGYPSYTDELATAEAVKFSVPDDNEMYHLEDFEEGVDPSAIERDVECLWNLIQE